MLGAVQLGLLAACIVLFVPMGMAGWHLSRNKMLFFSCALFITLAVGVHLTPYFPSITAFLSASELRKSLDEELQSGSNGESYYRSVLMCHERGTSLCDNCKRVAAFLRSHARTSKHYYCTVPRCGEVKVHKVMGLTGLREEMQLMTITKDVKSVEAEARMS